MPESAKPIFLRLLWIVFAYSAAVLCSAAITVIVAHPGQLLKKDDLIPVMLFGVYIVLITATLPMAAFVAYSEYVQRPTRTAHIVSGIITAAIAHLIALMVFGNVGFSDPWIIFASFCGGALGGYVYWRIAVRHTEQRDGILLPSGE